MKGFTDLDQSRKLEEILPIESADMYWDYDYSIYTGEYKYYPMVMDDQFDDVCIPCWSLTALMDVLDRGAVFKTPKGWACQYYVEYKAITSNFHSNPVDACVEIILEIHKQKDK